jgi:quinol monooxygenase YgiN
MRETMSTSQAPHPFTVLTIVPVQTDVQRLLVISTFEVFAREVVAYQMGFVRTSLYEDEDGRSVVAVSVWTSREAFEASRRAAPIRKMVAALSALHPKVHFLNVVDEVVPARLAIAHRGGD